LASITGIRQRNEGHVASLVTMTVKSPTQFVLQKLPRDAIRGALQGAGNALLAGELVEGARFPFEEPYCLRIDSFWPRSARWTPTLQSKFAPTPRT